MAERHGFVLLAALWLLVAISALGLDASVRAQDRRAAAHNIVEAAALRSHAASGLAHVRLELEQRLRGDSAIVRARDAWLDAADVMPEPVAMADGWYRALLRDPGAGLHLNRAQPDELLALLAALGVDARRAAALVEAIVGKHEGDSRPTRPFADLFELREVPGMDDALYALMRPHLTLVGDGRIQINSAPRPVLLTLPGFTDEAVRAIERRRQSARPYETVFEIVSDLSPEASRRIERHFAELAVRTRTATTALEAHVSAGRAGAPPRYVIEALLVGVGDRVEVTWQRER